MNTRDSLPVLFEQALKQHKKFITSTGTARLDALLNRPDAPMVIQRARAEDLHYLIKNVGINDSQEIMLYANPAQIKSFLDIELFRGDRFEPDRFLAYLDYLNDISYDKVISLIHEMDSEAFALLIHKYADVKIVDEDNDPQDEWFPLIMSPDNVFMIVFRDEEATGQAEVKRVVKLLYETDIALGRRVMFLCVYDLPSNMEENLFGLRENSMESMGFPNYSERLDIYEWVAVTQIREMVRLAFQNRDKLEHYKTVAYDSPPSGLMMYDSFKQSLFYDALRTIESPDILRMVAADFQYLVDAVLRARHKDLSVDDAWKDATTTAAAFVSVGLDFLTDSDIEMATFVLEKFYLKDIFRVGFTLMDQVSVRAKNVVKRLGSLTNLSLFDALTAAVIGALRSFPPRLYEGLKDPASVLSRDPLDYGEILLAGQVVDQAMAVLDYMSGRFGFDPASTGDIDAGGFEAIFNTAFVRSFLFGKPGIGPLNAGEIRDFIEKFLKDDDIAEGMRSFASREADNFFKDDKKRADLLREFTTESMTALISDLRDIDTSKPLDTRFIGDRILSE